MITNRPLSRMLIAASGRVRLHMPGHKGKLPAEWMDSNLDQTETAVTDDLFAPSGAIVQAQACYAKSADAAYSILLSSGATSGMLAMILSSVPEGSKVILARNAHHSAMSACIWGDLSPVFVWPSGYEKGIPLLTANDFVEAINQNTDAKAVVITRPDYYGICVPLEPIVQAAKAHGMVVLVDEAHGAHFNWCASPQSAMRLGADACVQSAHKTLMALTGGAVLHLRAGMDEKRALRTLRMVHTSSPSFLILSTVDNARAWMDEYGEEALAKLQLDIDVFWSQLDADYKNAQQRFSMPCDTLRIVIDVTGRGVSGWDAQSWLTSQGIDPEMADDCHVVFIPCVSDEKNWLLLAANALNDMPRGEYAVKDNEYANLRPCTALRVRRAALAGGMDVSVADAVGKVMANGIGVYPPGIPLCVPGEVLTQEILSIILASPERCRFGVENGMVRCVMEEE